MAERRWSIPPSPLEVQENGTTIEPDTQIIDFVNLEVLPVADGHVQVRNILLTNGITQLKCIRDGNCEYYAEVVFLTDSSACLLTKKVVC